ncbi:zinc-dependent dehydrogenase [Ammoniphilus sp. 3BR4]|uniref:zinc-dependent dehydrogenase n=1 Tax=Ammoniphilus sp. 3BR4 TaxID=3158265 RepID=UPI003466E4DA
MKSSVFYDIGDFRYEERAYPEIREDEVLIQMKACGLCGTDIHKAIEKTVPTPTVLGHEVAGIVIHVGKQVTQFQPGDRVFVAHHVPCFTCHYCQRGFYSLCPQFSKTNLDPGGFSEYIRVPALHVKHTMGKIPDTLSFEQGAMVEPVACCLHGFDSIDMKSGDSVLIMGAGQIGCIQAQIARHFMASTVMISDVNEYRLEKAKELGVDTVINSNRENIVERVKELTDGRGADIVIISAGIGALLSQAMECVARGGTILVFAPFHQEPISIPAYRFFNDEIRIVGAYSSTPYNYLPALELLKKGIIDVEKMVTHRYTLSELHEAIECAHNPNEKVLKVMIVP